MINEIKTIYISTQGDPSVGIFSDSAQIIADGDFLIDTIELDEEDRLETLEEFREKLLDAFEVIWGERPIVEFDFEIEERESLSLQT